ncbi:hypothetical protein HDV05_003288 [Chytridiales sp. JEL 0842]|nr:hypothetical protein HDV05_003288 [Chytridiales sp. JEL 0842]
MTIQLDTLPPLHPRHNSTHSETSTLDTDTDSSPSPLNPPFPFFAPPKLCGLGEDSSPLTAPPNQQQQDEEEEDESTVYSSLESSPALKPCTPSKTWEETLLLLLNAWMASPVVDSQVERIKDSVRHLFEPTRESLEMLKAYVGGILVGDGGDDVGWFDEQNNKVSRGMEWDADQLLKNKGKVGVVACCGEVEEEMRSACAELGVEVYECVLEEEVESFVEGLRGRNVFVLAVVAPAVGGGEMTSTPPNLPLLAQTSHRLHLPLHIHLPHQTSSWIFSLELSPLLKGIESADSLTSHLSTSLYLPSPSTSLFISKHPSPAPHPEKKISNNKRVLEVHSTLHILGPRGISCIATRLGSLSRQLGARMEMHPSGCFEVLERGVGRCGVGYRVRGGKKGGEVSEAVFRRWVGLKGGEGRVRVELRRGGGFLVVVLEDPLVTWEELEEFVEMQCSFAMRVDEELDYQQVKGDRKLGFWPVDI